MFIHKGLVLSAFDNYLKWLRFNSDHQTATPPEPKPEVQPKSHGRSHECSSNAFTWKRLVRKQDSHTHIYGDQKYSPNVIKEAIL